MVGAEATHRCSCCRLRKFQAFMTAKFFCTANICFRQNQIQRRPSFVIVARRYRARVVSRVRLAPMLTLAWQRGGVVFIVKREGEWCPFANSGSAT